MHTGFIPQHFDTLFPPLNVSETVLCQTAVAVLLNELKFNRNSAVSSGRSGDPFVVESGFRLNHVAVRNVNLKFNDKGCKDSYVLVIATKFHPFSEYVVSVKNLGDSFEVKIDNGNWKVVKPSLLDHPQRFSIKTNIDGVFTTFSAVISPEQVAIFNEVRRK